MRIRPPGEPGRHLPAMGHTCGFDGSDNAANTCGQPATHHLYAGSPDTGPSDWSMTACAEHFPLAQPLAFDWHEIGAVCDLPGTMWQARIAQGEGFCYWPAAEEAHTEQLEQIEATP